MGIKKLFSIPIILFRSGSITPPLANKPTPGRGRRSPSPEPLSGLGSDYAGFGAMRKLDSSNKGHQMMQKMGWKGSGLGSEESGIVEPIEVTIYGNPAKLLKLDTYIMHWVAVYLDKVGIVNRLLLNLFKRT